MPASAMATVLRIFSRTTRLIPIRVKLSREQRLGRTHTLRNRPRRYTTGQPRTPPPVTLDRLQFRLRALLSLQGLSLAAFVKQLPGRVAANRQPADVIGDNLDMPAAELPESPIGRAARWGPGPGGDW
jgi:hypothetical protein